MNVRPTVIGNNNMGFCGEKVIRSRSSDKNNWCKKRVKAEAQLVTTSSNMAGRLLCLVDNKVRSVP